MHETSSPSGMRAGFSGRGNRARAARASIVGALLLACASSTAGALDIRCIEASRYKHLLLLFDGDTRKFGDFLGVDLTRHRPPEPDACRAVLLYGPTGSRDARQEFNDVIRVISDNRGWLAAIYFSSPGGTGFFGETGQILRMFLLKTRTAKNSGREIFYEPDFAVSPSSLVSPSVPSVGPTAADWDRFAQRIPPSMRAPDDGWCASSCSFMHAAGIDRLGYVKVHRPTGPPPPAPADSERPMRQYLVDMDAGPGFIRTWITTLHQSVYTAYAPRFPRPLRDGLLKTCGADPERLQLLESQLVQSMDEFGRLDMIRTEPLRAALATLREQRGSVEQCVARELERTRLTAFDRLCGARCDANGLFAVAVKSNSYGR